MTRCERAQARLPRLLDDSLPGWRRRRIESHVDGCAACAAELARQRVVDEGLLELRAVEESATEVAPPDGLLESLLASANEPDLRARAAVPARAAISGARPGLSVAFLAGALALVGLGAWGGWKLGTSMAQRRRRT